MQNFDFSIFAKKNHLEVVLPTFKYQKWIFLMILSIFGPRNFFHGTNILGSRGFGKFQFFYGDQIAKFWKISKNWNFQKPLEPKIFVPWKNFPGPKMLKIIQQIHFLYSKVGKTTSRWFFWQKSKNQNFAFLKCFLKIFFKNGCASAWIFF